MPEVNADGNVSDLNANVSQVTGIRAQFSDPLKNHEAFTGFQKADDLANAYLEVMGKAKDYEGKLANSIPKLSDKATPEEITAFHKSLGVPDKATEYEFPKGDGIEHDPKMVEWAKNTFHEAKLNKEQASVMSKKWDAFMQELGVAQNAAVEEELSDADGKLKEEWKAEYDVNIELSKRAFKHFANADLGEFKAHPVLIKAFYAIGKAMGEDFSPKGTQTGGTKLPSGFVYDKSPAPPKGD